MSASPACLRREMFLRGLNKLEDRDTMKTAVNELSSQIQTLDPDGVSSLVSTLCRIDRNQKNFARRETVKLLVLLAAEDCPSREAFLSSHLLGKATKFLIHVFNDRDASVREAAAETLASIGKEWTQFSHQLIPGDPQSLFLKRVFKALEDSKREIQISASDALRMLSDYLAPLHKDLIKETLRFLKNPNFNAKANLIQALASNDMENGAPQGIIKSSLLTFRPFVVSFLGQQEGTHRLGHGLLHLISNPDWFTRKASVDAIRCVGLLLGPELYKSNKKMILRIRDRLQRQRFDRVKPVRDSVQQTMETYELISEGGTAGSQADDVTVAETMSEASVQMPPTEVDDQEVDGLSIISEQSQKRSTNLNQGLSFEIPNPGSGSDSGMKNVKKREAISAKAKENSARKERPMAKEEVMIYLPHKTPKNANQDSCPEKVLEEIHVSQKPVLPLENHSQVVIEAVQKLDQKINTLASTFKTETSRLSSSIKALHQELHCFANNSTTPSSRLQSVDPPGSSRPSTAASLSKDSVVQTQDLDVLYQKALTNQIDFFRILQKTGPVLSQLSLQTLDTVFEAFCWLLSERKGISRILPWIWQLTEQDSQPIAMSLSPEVKEKLLTVFADMKVEEAKEINQLQVLENTLKKLWSSSTQREEIYTPDAKTVQDDTESLYATSYTTELSPSQGHPY